MANKNAEDETFADLKSALNGLSFQSESDYPLEFVCWEKAPNINLDSNFVRQNLGTEADIRIEEADAGVFFESCGKLESWFNETEKANAAGFQKLQQLINAKLNQLRQFRIGETEVTILIVGSHANKIVGFKTTSVET